MENLMSFGVHLLFVAFICYGWALAGVRQGEEPSELFLWFMRLGGVILLSLPIVSLVLYPSETTPSILFWSYFFLIPCCSLFSFHCFPLFKWTFLTDVAIVIVLCIVDILR